MVINLRPLGMAKGSFSPRAGRTRRTTRYHLNLSPEGEREGVR